MERGTDHEKKRSKPFGRFCSALIRLMSVGFLFCGSTLWAESPDQKNGSEIRQPQGKENLETFWNNFDWTDLNPAEQGLWRKLGWNEASWEGKAAEPASESKNWRELTAPERDAATRLGYDEKSWDAPPSK